MVWFIDECIIETGGEIQKGACLLVSSPFKMYTAFLKKDEKLLCKERAYLLCRRPTFEDLYGKSPTAINWYHFNTRELDSCHC